MASYTLIGSSSIVQVLSPQATADMVAATIKTQPTGIVATMLVTQAAFDNGEAGAALTAFADAIEAVIAQGKAVGGSGHSSLDASGLQAYFVTFVVAYDPPGGLAGTVTVDVDVPVSLLDTGAIASGEPVIDEAEALIDTAYANLVSLAGGPAPADSAAFGPPPPPPPAPMQA